MTHPPAGEAGVWEQPAALVGGEVQQQRGKGAPPAQQAAPRPAGEQWEDHGEQQEEHAGAAAAEQPEPGGHDSR